MPLCGRRDEEVGIVLFSTMQLSRVIHVLFRPNFSNMSFYQAPWKYRERFTNVYRSTRTKGILIEESRSILESYREDLFVFFEKSPKWNQKYTTLYVSKEEKNNLFAVKQE